MSQGPQNVTLGGAGWSSCPGTNDGFPGASTPGLGVGGSLRLSDAGFKPDYFHVVNRSSLETATFADQEIIILAAAQLGKARLIDNLFIDL